MSSSKSSASSFHPLIRTVGVMTIVAGAFGLAACGGSAASTDAAASDPLVFAMPPGTENPDVSAESALVTQYIAESTGREVVEQNPADYLGVVEAVRQGHVDIASMSAFSTALSIANDSVDPLIVWEGDTEPNSTCYAQEGSDITTVEDVAGSSVAFVDAGSTSGHIMPKSMFVDHGLVDGEDYRSTFAGGHDSALLALVNGSVDVACSSIADRMIESGVIEPDALQVIGHTDPVPVGMAVVVSNDLDETTRQQLLENLPEKMTDNPELATLGGNTEYMLEPGIEPYEPLLKAAENAGIELEDLR